MMKNKPFLIYLPFAFLLFALASCTSEPETEVTEICANCEESLMPGLFSQNELIELNEYLDMPYGVEHDYGSEKLEKTIGRILFYDKNLSEDRTVSCASCHQPDLAFADNVPFSEGVNGMETERNSMALGNIGGGIGDRGYLPTNSNRLTHLFWDGRAENTEEQLTATIENPREMGMTMELLEERVREQPYYQILFNKVGFSNMTHTEIKLLISYFLSAISSNNSFFDKNSEVARESSPFQFWQLISNSTLILQEPFLNFSDAQELGKNLYAENCSSCHGVSTTKISFAYNGLAPTGIDDYEKFRVPPLRNIEVTGPYMHDGRFENLEEVVNFYSTDMENHYNLNSRLKEGGAPKRFNFTDEEKNALVEFLKTFTDEEFLKDEKFSNPFKE